MRGIRSRGGYNFTKASTVGEIHSLTPALPPHMVYWTRLKKFSDYDFRSDWPEKMLWTEKITSFDPTTGKEFLTGKEEKHLVVPTVEDITRFQTSYADELKGAVGWMKKELGLMFGYCLRVPTANGAFVDKNVRLENFLGASVTTHYKESDLKNHHQNLLDRAVTHLTDEERLDVLDMIVGASEEVLEIDEKIKSVLKERTQMSNSKYLKSSVIDEGNSWDKELFFESDSEEDKEMCTRYFRAVGNEYRKMAYVEAAHSIYMPKMISLQEEIYSAFTEYGLNGLADALMVDEYNRLVQQARHTQERAIK